MSPCPNPAENRPDFLFDLLRCTVLANSLQLQSPQGRQESNRLRLAINHGDLLLSYLLPASLRMARRLPINGLFAAPSPLRPLGDSADLI